jgi:hypothetical protein
MDPRQPDSDLAAGLSHPAFIIERDHFAAIENGVPTPSSARTPSQLREALEDIPALGSHVAFAAT